MGKRGGKRTPDYIKFSFFCGMAVIHLGKTDVYKYIDDLIC